MTTPLKPKPVTAEQLAAVMADNRKPRPPVVITAELLRDVMQAQIDERERAKEGVQS